MLLEPPPDVSPDNAPSGWGGARQGAGGARKGAGGARGGAGRPRKVITEYVLPDVLRWYCVRTKFEGELAAGDQIRQLGYALFSPTIWKPATRPSRGQNGVIRPGRPDHTEPLFKRYVFTQFSRANTAWRRIWRLYGVDSILSSAPDAPTPVPDEAIDLVRKMCGPEDCCYPDEPPPLEIIKPGAAVRIATGPYAEQFADFTGICRWSAAKRVAILLRVLGGEIQLIVPRCDIVEA